jgi:hypothetical protein
MVSGLHYRQLGDLKMMATAENRSEEASISGVTIPDSGLAQEATELLRDTEPPWMPHFKEDIIEAFYNSVKYKLDTTFGTVNADVMADKGPDFQRGNVCPWSGAPLGGAESRQTHPSFALVVTTKGSKCI